MLGELSENVVITHDNIDGFDLGEDSMKQYIDDGFDRCFELHDANGEVLFRGLLFEDSDDENEPLDLLRASSGCAEIEYVDLPDIEDDDSPEGIYESRFEPLGSRCKNSED
jgi:hypothetical protein